MGALLTRSSRRSMIRRLTQLEERQGPVEPLKITLNFVAPGGEVVRSLVFGEKPWLFGKSKAPS